MYWENHGPPGCTVEATPHLQSYVPIERIGALRFRAHVKWCWYYTAHIATLHVITLLKTSVSSTKNDHTVWCLMPICSHDNTWARRLATSGSHPSNLLTPLLPGSWLERANPGASRIGPMGWSVKKSSQFRLTGRAEAFSALPWKIFPKFGHPNNPNPLAVWFRCKADVL